MSARPMPTRETEPSAAKLDLVRPWQIHAEESGEERIVAIIVRAEKPGGFLQGRCDPETCKYWQVTARRRYPSSWNSHSKTSA